MRQIGWISAFALGLAACGPLAPYSEDSDTSEPPVQAEVSPETPTETPDPTPAPESEPRRAEIDWNSARDDFAAAQAAMLLFVAFVQHVFLKFH